MVSYRIESGIPKRYSEDNEISTLSKRSTIASVIMKKIEQVQSPGTKRSDLSKSLARSTINTLKAENDFIIARRRRSRDRKLELKLQVDKMRSELPNYDISQIRQLRLPFHEALVTNLHEAGFPRSAALIEGLITHQDEIRKKAEPGSSVFVLPQLKFAKHELGILTQYLKEAESCNSKESHSDECHNLLKLGIVFAFGSTDWWWLGEQLLLHSIRVSSSYFLKIGYKYEALSRFAYGRYLIDNMQEFDNALRQLKISLYLARNKVWSSKIYFPRRRGTLYMETNHAIFECMIREVQRLMEVDAGRAIILADQARKRAADACFREGETQALVIKGMCEMYEKHPKSAISSFNRAISIQERFGTVEEICRIKIHLAKAYLMDGCTNTSLKILMELKKEADEHGLLFYLAQAYKTLGEYYLSVGDPDKATPLLEKSIRIFKERKVTTAEIKVAKNLKAISGGLQLFPKYVDVLKKAGNKDSIGRCCFLALLKWKNEREDFWDDEDEIVEYCSCENIIQESLKKVEENEPNILDAKLRRLSMGTAIKKT